jgi:hypothetical protein
VKWDSIYIWKMYLTGSKTSAGPIYDVWWSDGLNTLVAMHTTLFQQVHHSWKSLPFQQLTTLNLTYGLLPLSRSLLLTMSIFVLSDTPHKEVTLSVPSHDKCSETTPLNCKISGMQLLPPDDSTSSTSSLHKSRLHRHYKGKGKVHPRRGHEGPEDE